MGIRKIFKKRKSSKDNNSIESTSRRKVKAHVIKFGHHAKEKINAKFLVHDQFDMNKHKTRSWGINLYKSKNCVRSREKNTCYQPIQENTSAPSFRYCIKKEKLKSTIFDNNEGTCSLPSFSKIEGKEKTTQDSFYCADEIDQYKRQIYLVKENSLSSLHNTLKMAQEAENSGTKMVDLLCCQHDTLNQVDENLNRIEVHNRIAKDNILILKGRKRNGELSNVWDNGGNLNSLNSENEYLPGSCESILWRASKNNEYNSTMHDFLHQPYKVTEHLDKSNIGDHNNSERYKILNKCKKYQFENDSRDDDMELDIDKNLTEITNISRRLKYIAQLTSEELDYQLNQFSSTEDCLERINGKVLNNSNKLFNLK